MKRVVIFLSFCLFFTVQADAQKWLNKLGNAAKEAAKNTVEQRVEQKAEEVTEDVLDKAEDSVSKKEKSKKSQSENEEEAIAEEGSDDTSVNDTKSDAASTPQEPAQKMTSTSRYDFVPGDQILFFEDFSQDAIGDFPALWSSNGSGEVKTVNIASGNWFHMNGEDAVYCYTRKLKLPANFIVEFDIIPDAEYRYGIQFTLYQDKADEAPELNTDLYPGVGGLHVEAGSDQWETKGYKEDAADWITGQASKNPVIREKENHVIIWVQQRRVRIYHQQEKVLDVPTNIYPGVQFDRIRFSGWDRYCFPYITNLKITTASPDTRSKLMTEGKLVTYGITFDVNKAEVKPESFGTLKSIADVLKENQSVRVKIIGHTDSDGDDAKNMELSQRRAASVKSELVSKFGIDASRMETEGAGESKPVASNDTPANKAMNCRVEFVRL